MGNMHDLWPIQASSLLVSASLHQQWASLNHQMLKGGGDTFLRQGLEFWAVLNIKISEGGETLQHILWAKGLKARATTDGQAFKRFGESFMRQFRKAGAALNGQ